MVKIILVLKSYSNSVFHFSVHNQGQFSKTVSKNKSMHSLINNCCEILLHLSITVVKFTFTYK